MGRSHIRIQTLGQQQPPIHCSLNKTEEKHSYGRFPNYFWHIFNMGIFLCVEQSVGCFCFCIFLVLCTCCLVSCTLPTQKCWKSIKTNHLNITLTDGNSRGCYLVHVSVSFSAVLSSYLLGEVLNLLGKLGCFLCVLGSILLVIHAPEEQEVTSLQDMTNKLLEPGKNMDKKWIPN